VCFTICFKGSESKNRWSVSPWILRQSRALAFRLISLQNCPWMISSVHFRAWESAGSLSHLTLFCFLTLDSLQVSSNADGQSLDELTHRGASRWTSCQQPNSNLSPKGAEEKSMSNCTFPSRSAGDTGCRSSLAKCCFSAASKLQVQCVCLRRTLYTRSFASLGYSAGVDFGAALRNSSVVGFSILLKPRMYEMASWATSPFPAVTSSRPRRISPSVIVYE
jgi:hypothetical protein